jgi:flagellar basal body-associated protein FliL
MRDENKKNSNLIKTILVLLVLLVLLVIGVLSVIYFRSRYNITNNARPRLTLDLYDDLDAFMQYDY